MTYDAPGLGQATFDWNSPFVVAGKPIELRNYPRWDNPYTHADFGSTQYQIHFGDQSLDLDFANGTRLIR